MVKWINQALVFSLELVMIGSLAYYGYKSSSSMFRYLLALSLPAVAIALWAWFAAPKSAHRLDMPYLALFRGSLFLVAALSLYQLGYKNLALIIALLGILTQMASYRFES